MLTNIVFYSGGTGSFMAAERVFNEDTHLLFTDTLIEHNDLYRFLIDSIEHFYKVDMSSIRPLIDQLVHVADDLALRKAQLRVIQASVNALCPKFHWLRYEVNGDGVSPWDIFNNDRYIGNSRVAKCSTIIKQRLARDYIRDNFTQGEFNVVLGIDWTEVHRMAAPRENWNKLANDTLFPLCDAPYIDKEVHFERLNQLGIDIPHLYKIGAAHNNCGGFCVRGGQAHFKNLLENDPKLFDYHAEEEAKLIEVIGKDVSILRKTVKGVRVTLPLNELKNEHSIDKFDLGACGCFVTDDVVTDDDFEVNSKWLLSDLEVVA